MSAGQTTSLRRPEPGDLFVVDDNPHNIGVLTGLLRTAGYQVRVATSGRRALTAIRQRPPELVLLDINMPELDGLAVCRELKAEAALASIPVIFLSALDDVADKVSAFAAGGVDYITKPFQAEEVLARVGTQLRMARLQRALEDKNRQLEQRNAELEAARHQAEAIFTALAEVLPGTDLDGRYQLAEKIGDGGFGAVFRATVRATGAEVAIKVLRPPIGVDARAYRARFEVEVEVMRRFEHPNIVRVLDAGLTSKGIAYLVMELLRGQNLAALIAQWGRLPFARCIELFTPACELLAEAHAHGILHRDIKPANLFVHVEDGVEGIKVVDFGIARIDQPGNETTVGRLVGTPVYMSPERMLGQAYDGRSDVYAVGVSLYEALTGRLPYDLPEDLAGMVLACVSQPVRPLRPLAPDLPAGLEQLVLSTLAKRPELRPTMRELAAALPRSVDVEVAPDWARTLEGPL